MQLNNNINNCNNNAIICNKLNYRSMIMINE